MKAVVMKSWVTAGTFLVAIYISSAGAKAQEYFGEGVSHTRQWLGEHGINFNFSATQFFYGVASGGREQKWDYGGKVDYFVNVQGGKLGLNEGLFIDLHGETRFGESINDDDGLLAPSIIAMSFPDPNANVTSITGLKVTQALSESLVVYVGKINTLDSYAIQFAGGPGIGGFSNTSLVFNPIAARVVPYSAAGAGIAFLQNGLPTLSLTVFDPEERATSGFDDLFARGVTLVPELTLRPEPFDLPGIYQFGATYSNSDFTSVDPSAWLSEPLQAVAPTEEESWGFYANFYQALWVDCCDPTRSWGLFGMFGISDGNPNPIRFVTNLGIGGRSMIAGRDLDRFGFGFFYLGLSDEFKDLSNAIAPQDDEYGGEIFYNYAFTPWCWLTGDLQVARPSTQAFDTAVIPGMRLQLLF